MPDNRLHVAFFTNAYRPIVNGVVRSVSSFRETISKQGHNVFIFAQAASDYQDQEPFIFRYPSLPLPIAVDVPAAIPVSPFVDQLLPALKLDVIHAHHPILLGQTAARKAADLGLPLVFTFHTKYWEYTHYVPFPLESIQEFLKNAVHNWLQDYMRKCQRIIIPSESLKDTLVRNYGLESGYSVIPTGIDISPFLDADGQGLRARHGWQDDEVIVSVGRLASEKNWGTLIQAVARVMEHRPRLRLLLIGDGPERQALEQQAGELGIGDKVIFMGQLEFDRIPAYLKAGDLFCFSSVTETQGLVTIEALAAGLPVVAVNGSGTRDIVDDGKEGILVPDDPARLASAISELLSNPARRRLFSDRAVRKARAFDMQHLGRELVDVYRQAIEDKRENRFARLSSDKYGNS
jgi:glycosyltransferase involved in cell wall biosynthesis